MAAMIASRRSSKLLEKLLFSTRCFAASPAPSSAARSFNTSAQMRELDDDDRNLGVARLSDQPGLSRRREPFAGFFSDVLDPFSPSSRSLSQLLNMMDQIVESPLAVANRMGMGMRRGWEAKEDEDALYLRMDMPGLGKEDVKVSVEQSTLVIRGEEPEEKAVAKKGQVEGEDSGDARGGGRRYTSRIDLPAEGYRFDGIRAEMKNGVLKVVVPKVKEEERKDAVQIHVE